MSAVLNEPLMGFRPMVEEDLPYVLKIERAAYAFPWSGALFTDCLRVGYCCWVVEQAGTIAGYAVMSVNIGESHILNLCIDPECHGMGMGGMLLRFVLNVAQKHKAETAFLEVRLSNEIAKQLYQRFGFVEVGMRRNYYPARFGREDAVVMAVEIP